MNAENVQSKTIDWLRFPLAIGVVLIHSRGTYLNNSDNDLYISVYNFIRSLVSCTLVEICVPTFFFVSGYLFFYGMENGNKKYYYSKFQKRIRTLFIPYILWNIIALIGSFMFAFIYSIEHKDAINELIHKIDYRGIFNIFWNWESSNIGTNFLGKTITLNSPINSPLWFIRDLFIISLLTPLILFIIRKIGVIFLVMLGIAYFTRIWINIPGLNIIPLFFFSSGSFFSIRKRNLITEFKKVRFVSYFITIILLVLLLWSPSNAFLMPLFVIFGIISTFNLVALLIENGKMKVNKLLSDSVFFIFASHMVLILPLSSILFNRFFYFNSGLYYLIQYFFIPSIVICICILVFLVLRKNFPKIQIILNGGK